MSEDFDIYGDLEHIEQEAKQESQQLVALQQKIKELQEKVNAVEQEKTDIVRKNEILLENVSSLLLTAKAEIKRKDATISDLSKQCDNVVFRRNDHVAKSVKYETKFTQTTLPHPAYVEAQNRSVECSDRKRSKSRIDDVRESNHNRDREQDWVHKSKVISERDRSHCRDRTTNSEKERHRDQERNRDHELDRYRDRDQDRNRNRNREHDSDRDRDRDRHRDRHRNSHHDRHESHKNHRSRERSRVKETHNVSSKKHQKLVKCHTREQERSSSQKHATDRHKPSKADDRHKSNTRLSEHKQAHKDIDRRTPEFSDRANHETVTNTDSDHKIKQMKQKNIETKRQEIASNTWEQPSTSNKSFHRSSPNCSKSLETVDTNTTVQICDDSRMQKKRTEGFIQQMQDNQTAVNGNSYQPKKAYSETPLSLITEAPPASNYAESFAEGNSNTRLQNHDENVHLSESTVLLTTYTSAGRISDEPNSRNVSDDHMLKSANLNSESGSSSAGDACNTLADMPIAEVGKGSCDNVGSNDSANHVQINRINEMDEHKHMHNKSFKRKLKIVHADDVQSDGNQEMQENICQHMMAKAEPHATPFKRQRKDESMEFSKHDQIQTNEGHEICLNQLQVSTSSTTTKHKDPNVLVSIADTLSGGKTDVPLSVNVSGGLNIKSSQLDEADSARREIIVDDACSITIEMTRNEVEKRNSKDIGSIDAEHHIQTNITNASDKKQDKRNKASKSKSRSAAADDENNDAGKKEQQNKLCPQEATTDEPNESLLEFERKVECLDSYQHNTIQSKAANRQLQKSSQQEATKHADLIAPEKIVRGNTDVLLDNVSDDIIMKSKSLDADSYKTEISVEDACSISVNMERNEDGKGHFGNIGTFDATKHAQINIDNELDKKEDTRNKSPKTKSRSEPGGDEKNEARREIQQNKLCHLKPTSNELNPSPLQCGRTEISLESSQYDTIQTSTTKNCHKILPNQPQDRTSSTVMNIADPTAPISAADTLEGSKTDDPRSVHEADNSGTGINADGSCSILVDIVRNEVEVRNIKDIRSSDDAKHAQININNVLDEKKDKRKKLSKRKLRSVSGNDEKNDARKEEQQNKFGTLKAAKDDSHESLLKCERNDESLESSQCNTIQSKATNRQLQESSQKEITKQADPTTLDALATSKIDAPHLVIVGDDPIINSMSLDESQTSTGNSTGDPCSIAVDMTRCDDVKGNSKDIQSNTSTNFAGKSSTNQPEEKKDKHYKSCKRKSRTKLISKATNVHYEYSTKKVPNNEVFQNEPANTEPNSPPRKRERRKVDVSEFSQADQHETNNTPDESYADPANNTQNSTCSVTTKKDDPVHNRETNSVLPLFTSVVENSVSAESSNTNNWSTNDKQQHSLSISERNSLSESKSLCLNLNDTRSNSYSAVLESGVNQPSEPTTMSIQTYFMTFNEQDDEHEKSTREDAESLPMNVETISENDTIVLSVASEVEVETNSTPIDTMSEIRCKAKVSTAEAIRERLRKRTSANVQKATPASKMSMSSIFPKRRLSIDSVVSITGKRKKVENTTMVDDAKQSCTPSTKLSSTYFSPIALPITSVLDSISNKLKSPTMKHSAWDSMLMTPMVVVHSPAKPSQNTNQHVPNYYASSPSDATLYNIMESLFQTPIKNEAPDRVSPPSATDNSNDDARQKSTTTILTSYENEGTCSTPLSSKPMARFCPDDDHTAKQLSHKSTGEIDGGGALKQSERNESNVPLRPDAGRQAGVSNKDDARIKVHQKASEHVQTMRLPTKCTTRSDKHSQNIARTKIPTDSQNLWQNLKKRLPILRTKDKSSQKNENNNYQPPSCTKQTAKKVKVVPDSVSDKKCENSTVPKQQQPIHSSSSSSKILQMAQRPVPSVVLQDQPTNDRVKPLKAPSKQEFPKSMVHVKAHEKSKTWRNAPNSSKCKTEDFANASTSSASNSITIVTSKTLAPFPTQIPTALRTNADEKRIDLTKKQSKDAFLKPSKEGGKVKLCDAENMQSVNCNSVEPMPCSSKSIKEPQQLGPRRLVATPTGVSFTKGNNMERLNPQTQTTQPVKRNCPEPEACTSKDIKAPIQADPHPQHLIDRSILEPVNSARPETTSSQTNAEQLPVSVNAAPTANAQARDKEEVTSTCVVSNVTLNLSLADNTSKKYNSLRKSSAPVHHVREMRIVKESPSLMRIYIKRK